MRYLPKSPQDRVDMLADIGVSSIDDLFSTIPEEFQLKRDLDVPRQHAESEIIDRFKDFAGKNAAGYSSFLGAGVYRHYKPVLIDAIVQRGEFLTSYTPYQPEIAQGTLQAMFEFQTMICELTGMEIANASMYDGSTGAAEAIMMAVRVTGRNAAVIARTVHPEYREVIHHLRAAPADPGDGGHFYEYWPTRSPGAGHSDHGRHGVCADPVAELLWDDRRRCGDCGDYAQKGCAADCVDRGGGFARRGSAASRG